MKRMKKICFSAILTIALICNMVLTTAAAAMPSSEEMYAQRELAGIQQFQRLMDYFESRAATASVDGDITAVYPEYYGGAYLNDDGNLVVVMTDMSDKATVQEVTQNTKLTVQHGAVSLNTLMATYELIWNTYVAYKEMYKGVDESEISPEMKCYLDNFVGVGVKQSENAVLVDLMNTDEKTIACVEQFLPDVEYVRIAEHENPVSELDVQEELDISEKKKNIESKSNSKQYYPGDSIHIHGYENGTIGFKCLVWDSQSSQYKDAFVTAGHAVAVELPDESLMFNENQIVYEGNQSPTQENGTAIGKVFAGQIGGKLDVALVILDDGVPEISGTTKSGAVLKNGSFFTANETLEGTMAYMEGSVSGKVNGKVKNVAYSYNDNELGVHFDDVIRCNYTGVKGDSGGVVYAQVDNGDNAIIGIHHGILSIFSGSDAIVIKGVNILDAYQGVIYAYS